MLAFGLALAGPVMAQSRWETVPESIHKQAWPAHLHFAAGLPTGSVTLLRRTTPKQGEDWTIVLPDGTRLAVQRLDPVRHPNGDITHRGLAGAAGGAQPVLLTEGRDATFGQWQGPNGRYRFEAWHEHGVLVDLGHPALHEAGFVDDAIRPSRTAAPAGAATTGTADPEPGRAGDKAAAGAQLDVLFLYSPGFAARYPGSATETRVRHLVAVANQVLSNSGLDLAVRAVGIDPVAYTDADSNFEALGALRAGVSRGTSPSPALASLRQRRDATGADLVSLLRPHDREVRGSCGVAYLPGDGPDYGVNVISDGFSSWSLCSEETLAHEIGHNFGAEHQSGASSGGAGFGQAFARPGQFHTVMGTFGSGDPDRGLRLLRFSNPRQQCGGMPCGTVAGADNARRIRDNLALVTGYRPARSTQPLAERPSPLDPDQDGDGVPESLDAFPFDPRHHADRDGDGVADGIDAFPDDPREWLDTDGDGIGDNADPDRDGDGVPNALDAFPLDPAESSDVDLDGVGDNADAYDGDWREWSDLDGDGIGDNSDHDTDGDGVADFDPQAQDLLVISRGNDRVLRLDGDSGRLVAVEIAEPDYPPALGERSTLAWNPYRRRVEALIGGEVRRYEPAARQRESVVLRAYVRDGIPGLPNSLSAAMAIAPDGSLYVADGNDVVRMFDPVTAMEQHFGNFGAGTVLSRPLRALAATGDGRLWAMDGLGNLVELDTVTGGVLRRREANFRALPDDPQALAMGPDGSLLVADAGNHRVLRLAPAGASLAEFIAPRSGGLDTPSGLAFDAGGRLLVSSAGTGLILRYDGSSGAFIDVFSQAPEGALQQPAALLFVPRIGDRYPRDARRHLRPRAGAWYDPANSGQGLDLQAYPGGLSLTWYTYEADGRPTWYAATGPLDGERWQAPLQRFTWDGAQAQATVAGEVSLQLSAEDSARFEWVLDGRSGSETLQHFQAGNSLEAQFPTALWYQPSNSGWGYSVVRQGSALALIAFLYDNDGEPTWAIGAAPASDSVLAMQRLRAPDACPGCRRGVAPEASDIGSIAFAPVDDVHATTRIDLADTDLHWQRPLIEVRRLSDTPTRLDGGPRGGR